MGRGVGAYQAASYDKSSQAFWTPFANQYTSFAFNSYEYNGQCAQVNGRVDAAPAHVIDPQAGRFVPPFTAAPVQ